MQHESIRTGTTREQGLTCCISEKCNTTCAKVQRLNVNADCVCIQNAYHSFAMQAFSCMQCTTDININEFIIRRKLILQLILDVPVSVYC